MLTFDWICYRKDFTPTARSVVCIRHFFDGDIILVDSIPVEGALSPPIKIQRKKPRLKIRSLVKSIHKDVVSLFPFKNKTAADIDMYTVKVLEALHVIGYTVLVIISDNNRVNRNVFERMCAGTLKASIAYPCNPNLKLFFLFDSVHLFKSIRNNWLNKKHNRS